jgi:hypothetical protein
MFVDFKQAYDSVNRASLWTILREMRVPEKLVRLTEMCYDRSKCCVRVGGENTRMFEVKSGLKQGCPIAPALFNIALEWVMRRTTAGGGLTLGARSLDRLAYADDVDLMAETKEEVGRKVEEFALTAARLGLVINEEKTKIMRASRDEPFVGDRVECGGLQVEAVDRFKYLGSVVTARNEMEVEILARVAAGTKCAWALNRCLKARWLSREAKVQIYKVIIRPVVLYGSEAWRMTKQMEHRLEVFENGILRRICGPVYDGGEGAWRRRHNVELREMTRVEMISDVVRARRLSWAGHIARRDEESLIKVATLLRPAGRRPVGRPRKRWRDTVEEDLRELGGRQSWTEAAQDRRGWRGFVAAARGLHGPRPPE